jgi:hypothetical protein
MARKPYPKEQVACALRQAESGTPVAEILADPAAGLIQC